MLNFSVTWDMNSSLLGESLFDPSMYLTMLFILPDFLKAFCQKPSVSHTYIPCASVVIEFQVMRCNKMLVCDNLGMRTG